MDRNLTQQLVHDLGRAIVQGQFSTGGHLPSEAEIGRQFGVSRSATREAVKMLAAKGLLVSRPRHGIQVLSASHWNMFDSSVLGWLLDNKPSRQLLLDFAQMRKGTEPESAALAAANATPGAVAEIEAALQRMFNAESGLDDSLEADIDFHTAILRASGNRFYEQMSSFTEIALRIITRFTNADQGVVMANARAHGEILEAIKKGNADSARQKMQAMLSTTMEFFRDEPARKAG